MVHLSVIYVLVVRGWVCTAHTSGMLESPSERSRRSGRARNRAGMYDQNHNTPVMCCGLVAPARSPRARIIGRLSESLRRINTESALLSPKRRGGRRRVPSTVMDSAPARRNQQNRLLDFPVIRQRELHPARHRLATRQSPVGTPMIQGPGRGQCRRVRWEFKTGGSAGI